MGFSSGLCRTEGRQSGRGAAVNFGDYGPWRIDLRQPRVEFLLERLDHEQVDEEKNEIAKHADPLGRQAMKVIRHHACASRTCARGARIRVFWLTSASHVRINPIGRESGGERVCTTG